MSTEQSSTRPNILLLFTDQQRYDTIAALGAPIIKTPALDGLVHEGTSFDRCYTPSPVCVSARHAMTTGLPPHRTGAVDNGPADATFPTFMEALADAGYRTHGVGKMHFVPDRLASRGLRTRDVSEPFGIDDYAQHLRDNGFGHVDEPFGARSEYYYVPQVSQLPAHLHHSHWVADRSIEFLQRRRRDHPFFLWSSFIKPHPPFESPTPWNKLYRAAEMPKPHRPPGSEQQLAFWNHVQNRYKYRGAGFDELLVRTIRAAYYSSISFIDYNIGRILGALGDAIEDTLVVFTSDHGEMLGDFGAFGKRCMLDGSVRVPLIVRWPGRARAGTRVASPVSLVDLHDTFLDVAGVGLSATSGERVSLADETATRARSFVFSQFSDKHLGSYMVTDGRWKYSYSAADEREWLHDLARPDGEDHDLVEHPDTRVEAARMRTALLDRFERDGYDDAVTEGRWREYGISSIPDDGDFGLLFQDPAGMQERVDALGPYARRIRPSGTERGIRSGIRTGPR